MWVLLLLLAILLLATAGAGRAQADPPRALPREPGDEERLRAVRTFADNVLRHGRDRYGPTPTPLFVDGVHVETRAPVEWVYKNERWIVSNLASQQHLFRTFAGLSALTGDPQYRQAAEAAARYHLEHLRRPCGLLQWGGHRFVDLRTRKIVGEQDMHEFKCNYPYYDFLWALDPAATERFIKALWNGHVLDWRTLDMNRHGLYDLPMGKLWAHEFAGGEPFFAGKGLTFINCGSDLIYAGGMLFAYTGDAGALAWAKRLAAQYVRARDPRTQLGAYQFSQPVQERTPVDDANANSAFGDRAKRQFGPEFGARALEGNMLDPGRATVIYGRATIAQLRLAERLGDDGKEFLEWSRSGLVACARHVYDPETNLLSAMFTDGTKLAPEDVKRPGYYSPDTLRPMQARTELLLSYVLGYRLTGDDLLWQTARSIARAHGLGDLGAAPGRDARVNLETACADPQALFSLLEVLRMSDAPAYLALARRLGDNIVATRFHHGFFLPGADYLNANFDALEPLALLALEARLHDTPEAVPTYVGGRGYIHGPHDGLGRTYDSRAIWGITRHPAADEAPADDA